MTCEQVRVLSQGFVFAIMPERIRTLDAMLTELNRSPICDRVVLPTGIRYLLNLDGSVIKSVEELIDGGNYVCASTAKLRRIAYLNITGPTWNNSARAAEGRHQAVLSESECFVFV